MQRSRPQLQGGPYLSLHPFIHSSIQASMHPSVSMSIHLFTRHMPFPGVGQALSSFLRLCKVLCWQTWYQQHALLLMLAQHLRHMSAPRTDVAGIRKLETHMTNMHSQHGSDPHMWHPNKRHMPDTYSQHTPLQCYFIHQCTYI